MKTIRYISRDATALNDKGNEILDDKGNPITIPEERRADYDLAYRSHEEPTEEE